MNHTRVRLDPAALPVRNPEKLTTLVAREEETRRDSVRIEAYESLDIHERPTLIP
jgi:hypothetical protein